MGLKERKRLGRLAESHGLTVMPDPDMKRSYVMRSRGGWWSTAEREIINWSELRSTEVNWNDIEDRIIALSIITTFE